MCQDQCFSDNECLINGCGHCDKTAKPVPRCTPAKQTTAAPVVPQPPVSPSKNVCLKSCKTNNDCWTGTSTCTNCITISPKPGVCGTMCQDQCSTDSECLVAGCGHCDMNAKPVPRCTPAAKLSAAAAIRDTMPVSVAEVERVCIADRSKSPDVLGAGLSYTCSTGGVNCTTINAGGAKYYPNTIYTHCDWAFGTYYRGNPVPTSCNFGGAAYLVNCSTSCTRCTAKDTTSDAALQSNFNYICGSNAAPDAFIGKEHCAAATALNSTKARAEFAMDVYYQIYRCAQPQESCDFNGTAVVAAC